MREHNDNNSLIRFRLQFLRLVIFTKACYVRALLNKPS